MRFVALIASAILIALVAVLGVATPAAAAAATSMPASCGIAERAPVLAGDEVDPSAALAAVQVPIIVLHGWLGTATHDESRTGAFSQFVQQEDGSLSRSMIGVLQNIPGAAVYTFDYRSLAARWVTDPGIGDALAEAIHCLAAASGHQAILVAHSMGGLAARQALSGAIDGVATADLVSEVVTFGTPNTGSVLAAALATTVDAVDFFAPGGLLVGSGLGLAALLRLCGAGFTVDAAVARGCSGVPTVDAFDSQAGIALRSGSVELGSLPPWPAEVHVVALAGDVRVPVLDALRRVFGGSASVGDDARTLSLGDIVVGTDSAEAGVDERHVVTCSQKLADGFADSLCQHANLMRNPVLAAWAGTIVAEAVRASSDARAAKAGAHGGR